MLIYWKFNLNLKLTTLHKNYKLELQQFLHIYDSLTVTKM